MLAAAVLLAAATAATATEIGTEIFFRKPTPPVVGCTDIKDALYVRKLTIARQHYELREFAEWFSASADYDENRSCMVLNNSPNASWKIVAKIDKDSLWFCVEGTVDFRPAAENNNPGQCFWVWIRNNGPRR